MKNRNLILAMGIVMVTMLSSCSQRLIDFTVISSKNVTLGNVEGERVKGKSMGFLGIGVTIKDAIDDALENAGRGYDMLVDGVVRSKVYPFYNGFEVEGTAVSSAKLKAELGPQGFEDFCKAHNILTSEEAFN